MHDLVARMLKDGPVVTDGGWGTELQAGGLPAGESPDAWNLAFPDRVEQVARAYVDAGSQVILTNTFRANRLALDAAGLASQAEAISRAGAEISRRAAGDQALVFASLGPSGRMLFAGDVTEEALRAVYAEQAAALAAGGADALVIETMSDLAEAKVALAAVRDTRLPVVVCMVFDSGKDLNRTMMGTTATEAAKELTDAGADVIGANCGQGAASYVAVCRQMRAATDRPIWVKPNAGIPAVRDGQVVYDTTPREFAKHARALIEAGAQFVGGCCGTRPEFIRDLRRVVAL